MNLRNFSLTLLQYIEEKTNKKEKNLKHLREMQHYGNEAILIDFNSDLKTALWFSALEEILEVNEDTYFSLFILEQKSNSNHQK